ncbi:hypothetical protein NEMBOFW57_010945 [Staphylotrichum longicolle]|uniref:Heterokaryon incompatibility domain-containing protein n=1 Tax=Staphylotrichum longicolle TaxID=669026 RepID=A0AAD4HUM0_9PEZI|nr:hypothetical protein NEMBOFW57_010945 [Staphylotrichum longicolle]
MPATFSIHLKPSVILILGVDVRQRAESGLPIILLATREGMTVVYLEPVLIPVNEGLDADGHGRDFWLGEGVSLYLGARLVFYRRRLLLNTHTHKLEFFLNPDEIPPYAILSHTWGGDEVTFKDLSAGPLRTYKDQAGGRKIIKAAAYAATNGWDYIWIDTCCIDKSDITELSEAINSMFRWYEHAHVCYAYLSDVPPMRPASKHPWKWSFRSSRWFTRGWTLQELLAPTFLEFLDRDWNLIGSREEWAAEVERATGIEVKQLANFQPCSIATKLSWAAKRQTTRVEDRAYSLLGLLGINMPLIYGEGERAFIRLQHELIRSSNDESIFAWGDPRG